MEEVLCTLRQAWLVLIESLNILHCKCLAVGALR